MTAKRMTIVREGRSAARRGYWAAFCIGVALMAGVDEIVFHQLLRWHHFYDRSTPAIGLVSDGLLHAVELFVLVGGFFLLLDARRRGKVASRVVVAGSVTGLGAFQLWDAVIDHKVLRVHQVRADAENLLPYDLAWVAAGLVLLAAGLVLTVVARRHVGRA